MLATDYQNYIFLRTYSRWREQDGRRETWEEAIARYINFFSEKFPVLSDGWNTDKGSIKEELFDAIRSLKVMPSMRALATAGPALEKDNVAGYNCSYLPVDSPRAFDEAMYISCCGTGVGFSVERQYINQLPVVAEEFHNSETVIVVPDSKIGWSKSFRELIQMLYAGQIPQWDVSRVRPAGAKLKTFGGRASGPEPLIRLFRFAIDLFRGAAGRKLSSIECHDLMCKVAEVVVSGGVRRSAMLSLSNLTDERMRHAKSGQYWIDNGQRAMANNSVCYTEKPDIGIFMREWESLYESRSGERGLFNRVAAKKSAERTGRRDPGYEFGCNPCSEILLRPKQFCNLTEVVIRNEDTLESLKDKVRLATILGTIQATLTDFRYLSKDWEKNTKEEALLGVSLTGIMDHPVLAGYDEDDRIEAMFWLMEMKEVAIETNKEWAARLGINPATAITAVKPSGTVSQLVDSSSGIHPRFSSYYIRRVRADKKDPLSQLMIDSGVPYEEDKTNPSTWVFSFPIKAPKEAVTNKDVSAISQLTLWRLYQDMWCEHKPSITVFYRDSEFLDVGAWVYRNFDDVSGISFLPLTNHIYDQAPYEAIEEEQYNKLKEQMPKLIDWGKLSDYELEDTTTSTKELACSSGYCEVV